MNTTESIKAWFRAAVPNPTEANACTQMGCHAEEFSELLQALGHEDLAERVSALADSYKSNSHLALLALRSADRVKVLDAICDQKVTGEGVCHMMGFDSDGALAEVDRSNWSKFNEDGRPDFDANGKIIKGPNYSPPDLASFVGSVTPT